MLSVEGTTAAGTLAAGAGTAGALQSASSPQPRLVRAAHEFEAQMMQELLKPLTSESGLDGEDDGSASGSGGALGAFATEAFGQALSAQGGFGIATSIVRELSSSGNKTGTTQVTGNLHGNTVISANK